MPVRHAPGSRVSRRAFLLSSCAAVLALGCQPPPPNDGGADALRPAADPNEAPAPPPTSAPAESDRVFPQGLASGDPRSDRVILWCRVEPSALTKTASDDIELELVVAGDEDLGDVVQRTKVWARADADHTVHVEVSGLAPGRAYHYRFAASGTTTRVGRTRTAPSPDDDVAVRFAFCSCQDRIGRYWHSWQALLDEAKAQDLDFILFLGDYIYETVNDPRFQEGGSDRTVKLPDGMDTSEARDGSRIAATSLADYRALYKAYRSDPLLREVHRLFPFILTWDDHEFADDGWQDHATSLNHVDEDGVAVDLPDPARRQAASRAFSEYQAVAITRDPDRADRFSIFRDLRWGKNVELFLTDQRLYRADHLIPEGPRDVSVGKIVQNSEVGSRYFVRKSAFDEREAEARPSLLGAKQKEWLLESMRSSTARWKVWANEVQLYQMALRLGELPYVPDFVSATVYVSCDQWDGFRSERAEILGALQDAGVKDLLVCTGDIHGFFASELHRDFDSPGLLPAGVEYVTAGISSASLKALLEKIGAPAGITTISDEWASGIEKALLATNPHMRHADADAYGFALVSIDATAADVTFVQMSDPRTKTFAPPIGRTKFRTPAGTAHVSRLA